MSSATDGSATEWVESAGLKIHYLSQGDGDRTMVVIPGITSPAMTWAFVGQALADAGLHVITLDVRGRGSSDRAPAGGYGLVDYAADTAAVISSLGLAKPVVFGHSMGARVAAAFPVLHPGVCAATVVADPPLTGPGRPPYPFPLGPYVDALHKAQAGATVDDMRPQFPDWTDDQLRLRAKWLATCDETGLVESYNNFHTEDFFGYWSQVPAPTLFVYGAESPVVLEEMIADVRAANPRAEVVKIARAAHMIPWGNLDDFVDAVVGFVDALPDER